jgi:hypothetical protein
LVNAVLIDGLLPQSYGLTSAYSAFTMTPQGFWRETNRITVLRVTPFISC